MFASLINLINDVGLGPEKRKVERYLETVTRESVYRDLLKVLGTRLTNFKDRELLQVTFDKYAIESPTGSKSWTEECFRNHIRRSYSDAIISDVAVRLLWRSFYFYARHPFPALLQKPQDAALDFDSFKRAALFTVFQTESLLGTVELDWYWREDAAFFRRTSIGRMPSSFSIPSTSCETPQHTNAGALSDAVDRLFAEGGHEVTRGQTVRRGDLYSLIDLLVRLRLEEQRWGLSYPFGYFAEADCEYHGVATALVQFLAGSDGGKDVHMQQLSGVINLLLWAVLFQPYDLNPMTTRHVGGSELASISCVISLFAPHVEFDNASAQQSGRQDTRIILEPLKLAPSESLDATRLRIPQALSRSVSAHVVLFTSIVGTTSKMIIGGYFPGSTEKGRHTLFQL